MSDATSTNTGMNCVVNVDYETTLQRVTDALKAEGFGVLTEIDVQATLKKKLDVDFRPYKILGACNPPLAYRALTAAPEVGLLLPCNVTVSQVDETHTLISIIDPLAMMSFVPNEDLKPIADEAAERLNRVIKALEAN
jgi:uncharacterized protein (DUF302 family)